MAVNGTNLFLLIVSVFELLLLQIGYVGCPASSCTLHATTIHMHNMTAS